MGTKLCTWTTVDGDLEARERSRSLRNCPRADAWRRICVYSNELTTLFYWLCFVLNVCIRTTKTCNSTSICVHFHEAYETAFGIRVRCIKVAILIEMLFGGDSLMDPRNHVQPGSTDGKVHL